MLWEGETCEGEIRLYREWDNRSVRGSRSEGWFGVGVKKLLPLVAILILFCSIAGVVCAQAPQEAVPRVRTIGVVRTAGKIPVPSATVKLTHAESGQGWLTWTDENGKFDLPGMPAGRYRIEVQQLGFEPAAMEAEFKPEGGQPFELTLRIAAFAAPAAEKPVEKKEEAAEPATEAKAAPEKAPVPGEQKPVPRAGQAAQTQPGQRPGPPAPGQRPLQGAQQVTEAIRQQMGAGGFQQVDPTGQANNVTPEAAPPVDMGPLGEASSSDAFLISGTVGRGLGTSPGMGFGMLDPFMMGMMGGMPGGFPGGASGGFPGGAPGQMGPEGAGVMIFMAGGMGPGGPPSQGRGPAGQPGQQGRGGQAQGQRPGQGQAGRGAQGQRAGAQGPAGQPQQMIISSGMENLWGMQRLLRMAANRFRFSLFNRYSNSVWNARPYSLTATDPPKIASYQEMLGINGGGPLRIPKIYDGREKTFFFFNYQLGRNRNPVDTFATVPTLAERGGDFSARGLQLYDPASNLSGPRTAFGSVIPTARLDSAAVGLLQFIPLPNLPGTAQNFHLQGRVPRSSDNFNIRIMHTISPKLNFLGSYGLNASRSESIQSLPTLRGKQASLGQNVSLGLTQQYSQRVTHDTRINWSRNGVNSLNRFAFVNNIASALGITGVSTAPINYGVPQINYTNFTDLNDPVPALRRNQTFRFLDNLTYVRNRHTYRLGGEYRRFQNNSQNDPIARGSFTFTGLMTSQLDAQGRPIAGTGYDFADFLLGLPQSTTVRFGSSRTYFRSWGLNLYAQDDWRVHPRFTLTYGLRYDFQTPPIELFDKIANLDMNAQITAVATVLPNQVSPLSGKFPRALVHGDYNNLAPRLGFAWRPKLNLGRGRNMVVRGGYGMFFNNSIYNQLAGAMANQPPHAQAQTLLTSTATVLTLQNGFPPVAPGQVPNTIGVDPNYKVGYAQIWNTSLETQFTQVWTLELTYTGTKGTHLDLLRSPNRAVPTGPLSTELTRRIPNAPGFTYDTFGASSIYHALQVRLQRRMSRGVMVMGSYTFGKSIDNASSIGGGAQVVVQDDTNFDAERGLSSFDVRHQLRAFYVWEMPFGERKRWAKKGWQASAFGNFTLNGNVTLTTGTPFTARLLGAASNNSGTGNNFSERPDAVADPDLPRSQRTPLHYFNTDAFVQPPAGRFGNAARNTITGPGTVQFNMALAKFVRFGRDGLRRIEFRWEAQNIFNTPNFTGLGTALGSSNYGRVLGARQMRTMDLQIRVNF